MHAHVVRVGEAFVAPGFAGEDVGLRGDMSRRDGGNLHRRRTAVELASGRQELP